MKTSYKPWIRLVCNEFDVNEATALEFILSKLKERGSELPPFRNLDELELYEAQIEKEKAEAADAYQKEVEFIKSLRYYINSLQHKQVIFLDTMDSLTRNHGETPENAFERTNRLYPNIFANLEAFESYVKSLHNHRPQAIPRINKRGL